MQRRAVRSFHFDWVRRGDERRESGACHVHLSALNRVRCKAQRALRAAQNLLFHEINLFTQEIFPLRVAVNNFLHPPSRLLNIGLNGVDGFQRGEQLGAYHLIHGRGISGSL
jgi:hypothetical protein